MQVYFRAYENRKKDSYKELMIQSWMTGAYVKAALQSTYVPMGFAKGQLPKYPSMPKFNDEEKNKEQKKREAEKLAYNLYIKVSAIARKRKEYGK